MENRKLKVKSGKTGELGKVKSEKKKIVVCGIGTGGHYFPAVVVGRELVKRHHPVVFLVRTGFHEEKIARAYGLDTFAIRARPFFGRTIVTKLHFFISLAYSSYRLMPLTRHNIGFSCGGFGSLPLIISCMMNRSPFYVFESNSVPGRATRFMARHARRVFLGIPIRTTLPGKLQLTGVPIRSEFKTAPGLPAKICRHILFMGGSQGATRINELALELSMIMPADYKITIISGQRDYEWVRKRSDARTRVIPFTSEPWTEIGASDIIVSRSGALAGYEIMAMRKKAVFIPFPFAIDDHQHYNGLFFAGEGGGLVIEEKGLTVEKLLERINELTGQRMNSSSRARFDAEKSIVDEIEREFP
jgi:UDP-N-acetylglucosamine--N-acetylmuramyl-(pentapeptide) pyrophosphoryl-undecaprenol N-acetylglucosamine transferase